MNYGVDENKRVTRTCKGWDRVTDDTETRVKCGARYTTKAAAPIGACPACMSKLLAQFWAAWEKDN